MITFLVCLGLLITGYLTYGTLVENTFGPVSYTHLTLPTICSV